MAVEYVEVRLAGRVAVPVGADINHCLILISVATQHARSKADCVMASETARDLLACDLGCLDRERVKSSSALIKALQLPAIPACLMNSGDKEQVRKRLYIFT